MDDLLGALTSALRQVTPEAYLDRNPAQTLVYPYLTFDVTREPIERNVDGFYLDVDIFDNSESWTGVFALETALCTALKDRRQLTADLFIRFNFVGSSKIPTGDETLKRRNVRFYIKTDWRNQ